MSGTFESERCVHRLDLGLYSHPKEYLRNGVRTHVNSKGKIPTTRSSEEDRTHDSSSRRTASPTHYRLSYSSQLPNIASPPSPMGPLRPMDTADMGRKRKTLASQSVRLCILAGRLFLQAGTSSVYMRMPPSRWAGNVKLWLANQSHCVYSLAAISTGWDQECLYVYTLWRLFLQAATSGVYMRVPPSRWADW